MAAQRASHWQLPGTVQQVSARKHDRNSLWRPRIARINAEKGPGAAPPQATTRLKAGPSQIWLSKMNKFVSKINKILLKMNKIVLKINKFCRK